MAASRDLGEFIRELRSNARISLRQLAEQAGVSNPYLSQIERGLRKPSAEVLQQIANALRVSTPLMYLRAGLLAEREGQGVLAAIAADPDLTDRHKRTLIEIYEAFRRETVRAREDAGPSTVETPTPAGTGDQPAVGVPATPNGATSGRAAPRRKAAKRAGRTGGSARKTAGAAARKAATRPTDQPHIGSHAAAAGRPEPGSQPETHLDPGSDTRLEPPVESHPEKEKS